MTEENAPGKEVKVIDWVRLTREFLAFRVEADWAAHEVGAFEEALVEPAPRFVRYLLQRRTARGDDPREAVRALYCFLLEKRYEERLNLLHFAFSIFEEATSLPDEVVARTPFPSEDGIPSFRYHGDPDSVIPMPDDQVPASQGADEDARHCERM